MSAHPVLVVNADDFGRSLGVNRGIVRAHDDGIVTSASLMVDGPAVEDAVGEARSRPTLSVGLHLDLAEWHYGDDGWELRYQRVDVDDPHAVRDEVDRQLDRFCDLVGCAPTHLDSHQHLHREEPVRAAVVAAGHRLGVPVRDLTPGIAYVGGFYGQDGRGRPAPELITVDALVAIIAGLPAGVTELGCHPGDPVDLDDVYRDERAQEVVTLCHPRVRAALDEHGVELRSFSEIPWSGHRAGPGSGT